MVLWSGGRSSWSWASGSSRSLGPSRSQYDHRLRWTWILPPSASWSPPEVVSSRVDEADRVLVPLSMVVTVVVTGASLASAAAAGVPREAVSKVLGLLLPEVLEAVEGIEGEVLRDRLSGCFVVRPTGRPRAGAAGVHSAGAARSRGAVRGALRRERAPPAVTGLQDLPASAGGAPPSRPTRVIRAYHVILEHQARALLEDPGSLYRGNIFFPEPGAIAWSDNLTALVAVYLLVWLATNRSSVLAYNASRFLAFAAGRSPCSCWPGVSSTPRPGRSSRPSLSLSMVRRSAVGHTRLAGFLLVLRPSCW